MAEAGVAWQCLGAGVRGGDPVLIAPTGPAAPGRGRAPARASQPHHAPQATKLWPRRQL